MMFKTISQRKNWESQMDETVDDFWMWAQVQIDNQDQTIVNVATEQMRKYQAKMYREWFKLHPMQQEYYKNKWNLA